MTHLAQFSAFSKQGEVLCTRGLEYLLETAEARQVFARLISSANVLGPTVTLPDELTWRAEVRHADGARPDLEATWGGKPFVMVEAKLGASLAVSQVRSYAVDLASRCDTERMGLVVILVPSYRLDEASGVVNELSSELPACGVTLTSWEDVLNALSTIPVEPFAGDFGQFSALYRALIGDDVAITGTGEWRKQEAAWETLIDRATRRLVEGGRLLPMGSDEPGTAQSYRRRYVCRRLADKHPCFSVGVRDPFVGHETPVWIRFHRDTPMFAEIRNRLMTSRQAGRIVIGDGHLWLPLDVPLDTTGNNVIEAIVAQAEEVAGTVYAHNPTLVTVS